MQYQLTDFFWSFLGRSLLKGIVLTALGVVMVVETFYLFAPSRNPVPAGRRKIADHACTQVSMDLPKRAGMPSLAVLDISGDSNGTVTKLLREKVGGSGAYRLIEDRFLDKLMKELGRERTPVATLSDAVAAARRIGADLVLFGEVSGIAKDDAQAFRLNMRMAERQSGQAIFVRSYSKGAPGLATSFSSSIAEKPRARRLFIWLLFSLLLPVVCIPLIRKVLAKDSNAINLVLLLSLTAADMLLALIFVGFDIDGFITVAILLAALAASAFYNYSITSFVEEMEH